MITTSPGKCIIECNPIKVRRITLIFNSYCYSCCHGLQWLLLLLRLSLFLHLERRLLAPSALIIKNQKNPDRSQNTKDDITPDIRARVDYHILLSQLKPQSRVDHAGHDGAPSQPAMHIRKLALATRPLEVSVLQNTQEGLKEYDCANDNETNDDVGAHRMTEIAHARSNLDAKTKTSNHHDEPYQLDWNVHRHDFVLKICVLQIWDMQDRKVERDCAQRVEHNEDDGHDASVCISLSVPDSEVLRARIV